MKRGVKELEYFVRDIDGNLPKRRQKDAEYERAPQQLPPCDAYEVPLLATVSEVDSGHLSRAKSFRPSFPRAVMAIATLSPRLH